MTAKALDVEIAIQSADGARVARANGASRLELCTALSLGGLTPSIGTVEAVVTGGSGDVHVLVRSRPGDFVYGAGDVDIMVRDIGAVISAGAAGVVVGALTTDGRPDQTALREFVAAAGDATVTFHRAVDVCDDSVAAVDILADLGVHRVLTSGRAESSVDGIAVLRQMAEASAGRLEVMAGGGVTPDTIAALADTGIDAVHLSARVPHPASFGSGPGGGGDGYDVTDAAIVAAAVRAASGLNRSRVR